MSENPKNNPKQNQKKENYFSSQIDVKAKRKIHAKLRENPEVWFGLGMMGLIGWSVVVPTLLGAAFGHWLDAHHANQHSWTLALLMAGLTLGCFNAWHWVDKEDRAMHDDQTQGNPSQQQPNQQENDDEPKPE